MTERTTDNTAVFQALGIREIIPMADHVMVALHGRKAESEGGIAIPEISRRAEEWGVVIAAGDKVEFLSPGHEVYVSRLQGTHYIENGVEIILIREPEVKCTRLPEQAV